MKRNRFSLPMIVCELRATDEPGDSNSDQYLHRLLMWWMNETNDVERCLSD